MSWKDRYAVTMVSPIVDTLLRVYYGPVIISFIPPKVLYNETNIVHEETKAQRI